MAVAATMGMTVPLATPASAASCTEVQSAQGTTASVYRSRAIDVSSTLAINVANCSGFMYRYTVFVFESASQSGTGDPQFYGQSTVSGTTSFGTAHPPKIRTSELPVGKTRVGFGYLTEKYNWSTGQYDAVKRGAWYIHFPGRFNTATGENVSTYPYTEDSSCSSKEPIVGYNPPCFPLPF